jgi:hypothetical protein
MTYFVETMEFKTMLSYKPYAVNKQDKKKVKYNLLDSIKNALGDKWERLKEGTRQAFDMVCFFSAELGFFYASDEYLAERHAISERTIQYRLKELEELGQVVKVHRRAKRCNGRGKPVYLFVNHPYFNYWMELLNIDFITDCETENAVNPCESKEEEAEKVPTFHLPKKQESNIYKQLRKYADYKINDLIEKGVTVKYLSSYVGKLFKSLEMQSLYYANRLDRERMEKRQEQAYKGYLEVTRDKLPFYNWLDS